MYRAGDYVYPADLPRPVLCRVADAEPAVTPSGIFQILTLQPLDGPWRDGTQLVRFAEAVRPAPRPATSGRDRSEAAPTA